MASCLVWTAPSYIALVYTANERRKNAAQLLANFAVATNYTATVHHDRKQQKIARVNRYLASIVAHQGACFSAFAA